MNDKTLNDKSRRAPERRAPRADDALVPPVNVYEDATGITLSADLPGVTRERLNLQIDADSLIIEGEIALRLPDNMAASHAEVALPMYRRVFTLSKELDTAQISAEFRHGVLTLRIPKAPHAQPRRIEVAVH